MSKNNLASVLLVGIFLGSTSLTCQGALVRMDVSDLWCDTDIVLIGYHSKPVVVTFGVEIRTENAEYLQGEEPVHIIKNQGPNTVTFGKYYRLQRYQDGDWVTIPFRENVGFPALLMILKAGEKYSDRIHFGFFTEVPGEGRYRIAKELSIEEMDLILIKYAEFYIRSNWSYGLVWNRFRMHIGVMGLALMTITILFMMRKRWHHQDQQGDWLGSETGW
jgi:hypothetical protein